jgi:hypothetical protein
MSWAQRPALSATVAAMLAFCWQALTVHYYYEGNWTALYCTGALFRPSPAALAGEHIYRLKNSYGYDGQIYHYMAHDPFIRRGFTSAMDQARFRYRRILVPLAAWVLAGGQDRFIDPAYLLVVLASVFAGTWWVAHMALDAGLHPAWSLGFPLLPAVVVSLDRLTVDATLAALVAGAVYFARRERWVIVWVLCAAGGLVRETGLLVPAGIAVWCVYRRRFRLGLEIALAAAPAFAWYGWVNSRTAPVLGDLLSFVPFAGLVERFATPYPYQFSSAVNITATVLDYAALAGIVAAVAYCAVRARKLAEVPEGFVAFAFVALVAAVSTPAVWVEAYAFTRGYSPLILLVGLDGFRARSWAAALPLALTAPRIGLELGGQIVAVAHGLTRLL